MELLRPYPCIRSYGQANHRTCRMRRKWSKQRDGRMNTNQKASMGSRIYDNIHWDDKRHDEQGSFFRHQHPQ